MTANASATELLPLLSSWPLASLLALVVSVAATLYLQRRRGDSDAADEKNAVTAALTGFLDSFKKSAAPRALPRATYAGKVVLVTGANTGLGFGIAQRLAELQCTVIVVCRSNPEETAAKLRAASGNSRVSSMCARALASARFCNILRMYADLSDTQSVHNLADALLAQQRAIDCVVLNAAVLTTSSKCGVASASLPPARPAPSLTFLPQRKVQAAARSAIRGQRRRQRHSRAAPFDVRRALRPRLLRGAPLGKAG